MSYATMNRSAWIADGLRWIGSLCATTADAIDRGRPTLDEPLEPTGVHRSIDEYLTDVRFRIHNRY